MTRKSRIGSVLLLTSLAAITGCASPVEPYSGHVLLLTVDAMRPDYMSLNGYDRPTTPFMDSLARSGWYYEGAIAPVPRTTPALASLLTGAYPHRTGVRRLTDPLGEGLSTLAEIFQARGYETIAVVTNTLLLPERGLDRGFRVYDMGHDVRRARQTTDVALRLLGERDPSRPVFLWIHYIDPHAPYHSDPELARLMDPGYEGPYRDHFGWAGTKDRPLRAFPEDLAKKEAVHRNRLPEEVNAHIRRLYAADIRATDQEIERLVLGAESLLGDQMITILTADHGESLGEHDFFFDHGDYVYNAGLRVPLALVLPPSHPDQGAGRCAGWVSLVDLVPTLLDLLGWEAGERIASQLEGRSLAPCPRGEPLPHAPVFAESGHSFAPGLVGVRPRNDVSDRLRAVYLGDWKLIWTPALEGAEAWQLYHVGSDPEETLDLYDPELPQVKGLKTLLERWMEEAPEAGEPRPISEEDMEALRSLGYVE